MEAKLAKTVVYYDINLKPWAGIISGVNQDGTAVVCVFPDGTPLSGGLIYNNVSAAGEEPAANTWAPAEA